MRFTPCRKSVASPTRAASAVAEAMESRTLFASYFVDAAAITNGNGSSATPFKTIQAAANLVNPGDVVNVRPGTYNEKVVVTRSGSAASPILFKATAEGVIVTSTSVQMWEGMIDIRASNVTFDNIDVRDSEWYGYIVQGNASNRTANVTVRNAHTARTWASGVYSKYTDNVRVENNRIEDACISPNAGDNVQECITFGEVDGFEAAGNVIWNNAGNHGPSNGGEGIDAKGSSRNGLIRDNLLYSLDRVGIYLDSGSKQGTGPDDDRPMANITITRNVVHSAADGVVIASELGGTVENVVISNNLLYNNKTNGISIAGYLANGPRKNILIVNNTVHSNGYGNTSTTWGGGINVQTGNYTNIRIRNNIVTNNESWQIAHTEKNAPNAPVGQLTVSNNIASAFAYSYWYPQPALIADPKFVNAAAGDFRLQSSSPAINFGATSEAPTIDLTNAPRYAAPDSGAFEYSPPTPNAVTLDAASDTGVAGDKKTKLNNASAASKLSFVVSGTVAGATVSVYSGSTLLGIATAIGPSTTVTTNGAGKISDGAAAITAAQTFAEARSAASAPLFIVVDSAAPKLAGVPIVNIGTSQPTSRSQVRTITWTFTEPVIANLASFSLLNRDSNLVTSLVSRSVTISGVAVTLHLDVIGVDASPHLYLGDGNYELSISPTVADDAGNALDANGDGTPGETARLRFHKLLGDFNGDRRVTNADYLRWKSFYNQYVGATVDACLDLNGSGRVTNADYLQWKPQYNKRLAALSDGLLFT